MEVAIRSAISWKASSTPSPDDEIKKGFSKCIQNLYFIYFRLKSGLYFFLQSDMFNNTSHVDAQGMWIGEKTTSLGMNLKMCKSVYYEGHSKSSTSSIITPLIS